MSDNPLVGWTCDAVWVCYCGEEIPFVLHAKVAGTVLKCPKCGHEFTIGNGLNFDEVREGRNFSCVYRPGKKDIG
jgi:hypothetical protein